MEIQLNAYATNMLDDSAFGLYWTHIAEICHYRCTGTPGLYQITFATEIWNMTKAPSGAVTTTRGVYETTATAWTASSGKMSMVAP